MIKSAEVGLRAKERSRDRFFVMAGLTLGLLLASLDQTVVGTSLPRIVADLGGLSKFSWLFSAYMLAATIMIPLAGKMSDKHGRRPVFLVGMLFFMTGSALSGFSQNMDQLIIFRFVQGFGGGAMFPIAVAVVADLYPPTQRGKMQGMLGAVFAMASIIGPFIGGYIVDNMDWRWVFYVNLPVGLAAVVITSVKFPRVELRESKPIDYMGMATLIGALSSGLLITFWGGSTYAWDSLEILSLATTSAALTTTFLYVEMKAEDPVVPLHLFRDSVFALSSLSLMIMVMGLLGVAAFMPLFLQAVVGISATHSGAVLIPLMVTAMVGAIVSGVLLKRTGYKLWILAGPIITAAGLYLLSTLDASSTSLEAVTYLMIAGTGLGFTMSNFIVAGQNVVRPEEMGVASSTMTLFRTLGGSIGVTVLGVLVNRRMNDELATRLPPGSAELLPSTDMNTLGGLLLNPGATQVPPEILETIRTSLGESITFTFLVGASVVLGAFVISTFIRSVPLKDPDRKDAASGAPTPSPALTPAETSAKQATDPQE